MFTGLVEMMGRVTEAGVRRGAKRIGIDSTLPLDGMADGESVAVDGVCLTVVERRGGRFFADVIPETLSATTLGGVRPGDRVNLERSLRLSDRLGGHLVQGHVDAAAPVVEVVRGGDYRLRVALPAELRRYVSRKGSVTLQGVSLTVAGVERDRFEVALIPETLERTTLGGIRAGDRVNVEVDLLARYLETLMGTDDAGRNQGAGPGSVVPTGGK